MHVVIEEQALQLHQNSLHAVRGTPTLMPPGVVWAQGGRFELEEVCAKDILPASWAAALPIAGPCQRGVLEEVSGLGRRWRAAGSCRALLSGAS